MHQKTRKFLWMYFHELGGIAWPLRKERQLVIEGGCSSVGYGVKVEGSFGKRSQKRTYGDSTNEAVEFLLHGSRVSDSGDLDFVCLSAWFTFLRFFGASVLRSSLCPGTQATSSGHIWPVYAVDSFSNVPVVPYTMGHRGGKGCETEARVEAARLGRGGAEPVSMIKDWTWSRWACVMR